MPQKQEILLLNGSPKIGGNTEKLTAVLETKLTSANFSVCNYSIAKFPVAACNDCGACITCGNCRISGDGFNVFLKHLEECVCFVLITPLYFAGPPAHLKALIDRLQIFWARRYKLEMDLPAKTPAYLLILGEGGDPFGKDPLISIVKSAFNNANVRFEDNIYDFTGKCVTIENSSGIDCDLDEIVKSICSSIK
ncbi:MAG: flavodoxin family protein [Coriobacteriales bacterium]|nr:flavodoxin family protein [Coriobacteriales bacterium]